MGARIIVSSQMACKVRKEDIDAVIAELPMELQEQFGEDFTDTCKELFDKADKDTNGKLNVKELLPSLLGLWGTFNCTADPPKEQDAVEIQKQFDEDGDGLINYQEFATFCKVLYLKAMSEGAA